ncbi:MAG: VanZ family protein [Spirochaetes bacterium]|nr:VanZ family protein [Spirochaetota bacterium]
MKKNLYCLVFLVIYLIGAIYAAHIFIPKFIPAQSKLLELNFNQLSTKKSLAAALDLKKYTYQINNIDFAELDRQKWLSIPHQVNGQNYLQIIIPKEKQYKYLQLSAQIMTNNIKNDRKHNPEIFLYSKIPNEKINWSIPHKLNRFTTWSGKKNLRHIFYVPYGSEKHYFILKNTSFSGDFYIKNVILQPVKINQIFKFYRIVILLILFLVIFFLIIFNFKFIIKQKRILLTLLIITIGILGPKKYIYLLAGMINMDSFILQKAGHYTLFLLLTFLLLTNKDKVIQKHPYLLFWILSLIALMSELLQYFTFKRQMTIRDWFIDLAGIISAYCMVFLFKLMKTKLFFLKENQN